MASTECRLPLFTFIYIEQSVIKHRLAVHKKGKIMATNSAKIVAALKDDTGLTTAEYAVGTVAVAGLGGVLLKLLTSDGVRDLIWNVITTAFSRFFG